MRMHRSTFPEGGGASKPHPSLRLYVHLHIPFPQCVLSPRPFKTKKKSDRAVVVFTAIAAPLKLKASRGPPTPINRNQASQPRGGQSMLGKRSFDTVSSLLLRVVLQCSGWGVGGDKMATIPKS